MFDNPALSLIDMVAMHARYRGRRTAVIGPEGSRDWQGLNVNVERLAAILAELGVRHGERIALLLPNSIPALEAMLATLRCGGVMVPLSAFLKPEALAGMIDDAGATMLVTTAVLAPLAQATAKIAKSPRVLVGLDFAASGWTDISAMTPPPLQPLVVVPTDPMNIIYSSGTTGLPKGIVHSHHTRILGAMGLGLEFRIDAVSVSIIATPLYTNGTWMTLLPTLCTGGTTVLMQGYTAEGFLDAVEQHGGTHAFLVPTQIRGVLDAQRTRPRDLASLRMIISAGSAIPRSWKDEAIETFGGRLMELYGLTEGVGTTLRPEDMRRKPDSVGTPIGAIDIRILDDQDRVAPPDTIGEIVGYGPGLMIGYHNRPEATREAIWRDERGRTFLRTGDIGRMDTEGFLYVLDRKKDMIVSGGINVFAKDIEEILHQHPDVFDVAVVGVPHPKWVETPVALVIPKPGVQPDTTEIRNWANSQLARHQQLDRVILQTADFPRNALVKVLKRQLRESLS